MPYTNWERLEREKLLWERAKTEDRVVGLHRTADGTYLVGVTKGPPAVSMGVPCWPHWAYHCTREVAAGSEEYRMAKYHLFDRRIRLQTWLQRSDTTEIVRPKKVVEDLDTCLGLMLLKGCFGRETLEEALHEKLRQYGFYTLPTRLTAELDENLKPQYYVDGD